MCPTQGQTLRSDAMTESVHTALDESVVHTVIDDGKANALTHEVLAAVHEGLDLAEAERVPIVIEGRPGRFSAGFDLAVIQSGPEEARGIVRAGADLALRIFEFPHPVVLGCTGHAVAMGAILLLAADVRVGGAGEFKIGMNEVAIGLPLPVFATELARDRLSKRHFLHATNHARLYAPDEAVDAGYLDEVVPLDQVGEASIRQARALADALQPDAFVATRVNVRSAVAEFIRSTLDADLIRFTAGMA